MSNYCVPLLRNSETHPIVLQLAKLACNVAQRHHSGETCDTLSPMFVNSLLEQYLRVYESWDLSVKQEYVCDTRGLNCFENSNIYVTIACGPISLVL
jgi:hypothetical protein